jgi:hypothetical protein
MTSLKSKLNNVLDILKVEFPEVSFYLLHRHEPGEPFDDIEPYDEHFFCFYGPENKQRGRLTMKFYGWDELLDVRLDFQCDLRRDLNGIKWIGRKPANYESLEALVDKVYRVFC